MDYKKSKDLKNDTIELDMGSCEALDELMLEDIESYEDKTNVLIPIFTTCIKETKKEIVNKFTFDELFLILSANNSTAYCTIESIKEQLLMSVYGEFEYNVFPEMIENINIDVLMTKLTELTEFKSYVLVHTIKNFSWKYTFFKENDLISEFS